MRAVCRAKLNGESWRWGGGLMEVTGRKSCYLVLSANAVHLTVVLRACAYVLH